MFHVKHLPHRKQGYKYVWLVLVSQYYVLRINIDNLHIAIYYNPIHNNNVSRETFIEVVI